MRAIEKRLRERLKALEQELNENKHDLARFQDHFKKRFRWWVKLVGDKSAPSLAWLIEDDAKFLRSVKEFWWG